MAWTSKPVSQQDKTTALWKHAAVLLQHHGQLPASARARWKLIKQHRQHLLQEQQALDQPEVQQ